MSTGPCEVHTDAPSWVVLYCANFAGIFFPRLKIELYGRLHKLLHGGVGGDGSHNFLRLPSSLMAIKAAAGITRTGKVTGHAIYLYYPVISR